MELLDWQKAHGPCHRGGASSRHNACSSVASASLRPSGENYNGIPVRKFFRERFAQRGQFMDSSTGKTELSHDDAGFNTR
jgi:hypothetical protein